MQKFFEFIDKKEREAKHQLKIIEKILGGHGFTVKDHINNENPYVFVYNPKKNTFFDGIRVYKVGDQLSFRVQKEEKTHPFGRAYPLAIEDMFTDLVSDYKPEEAGKKIIEAVLSEVKKFFEKSSEAEKDIRDKQFDKDPFGKVQVRGSDFGISGDYSNLTYSKA